MIRLFSIWLFSFSTLAFASNVQVINTGNDFNLFLDASHKNPEQISRAWDEFEEKYQLLYDDFVFKKDDPEWEGKRTQYLDGFFGELSTLQDGMNEIFAHAEDIAEKQALLFKKRFPDLKENTPVVFMPSVLSFNGKGGMIRPLNKMGVLIGVDGVVLLQNDIDVLFSHEFFHVYQFDKLDENKIWLTMASPLWFEGFASFVSGMINPEKTDAVILMDEELAKKCNNPAYYKSWARDFLTFIDTPYQNNPEADSLKKEWFQMNGKYQPPRRGYCLGLLVLRDLVKNHSIEEMLLWNESQFAPAVKSVLKNIAQ